MNPWNEWLKVQIEKPQNKLAPQIKTMHALYGIQEGEKCGDCVNFKKLEGYAGTYFKCRITKMTHGSKTDWRVRWPACGKFEREK